jgi:hypothetical protein
MKHTLAFLFLLCAALSCHAAAHPAMAARQVPQVVAAGGCSAAGYSDNPATSGNQDFGDASHKLYIAAKFTAGATETICRVDVPIYKFGSPTFNITAGIYSHDSMNDSPNALIGTQSGTVSATTLGTSDPGTLVQFTGLSASLTSGTVYWVALWCSAEGDDSNQVHWSYGGASDSRFSLDGDGAGVWSGFGTRHLRFAFFK